METKHTPGPWSQERNGWIAGANGESVIEYEGCGSHTACWPNPHDMHLVLAATEMLQCLNDVLPHLESIGPLAEFERARAVIEKATGHDG